MERVQAPALDVHKPSPVRGQLEPWDPRTPKGARYIQCTDTCDELKVLLPPGTAGMYEQLLKLESYELSKKTNLSWARIMEIRHLKDRMIRKCQKLVKTEMPTARTAGLNFVFQTLAAPADFRLKEMEKWFREQQKKTKPTNGYTSGQGYSSGRDISLPANTTLVRIPTPVAKPIPRAITAPEPPAQPKPVNYVPPIRIPHRIQQQEHTMSATLPSAANEVFSPPPLPVLLLSQREDYGLETHKPALARETEAFKERQPPEPDAVNPPPHPIEPFSPNPLEGEAPIRPGALARRSSIGKRVSWADSQDILDKQVAQYANAARDAQSSGKWEEVHSLYLEQVAGLENLHLQVKEGLEHLRSETEHLQKIDETIRRQREVLTSTFAEFEQKHKVFQDKVQEALSEANESLGRPGHRTLSPIDETA